MIEQGFLQILVALCVVQLSRSNVDYNAPQVRNILADQR